MSMRMQTFSVKLHVCKILKTKNCVPFEVQYYSRVVFLVYKQPMAAMECLI